MRRVFVIGAVLSVAIAAGASAASSGLYTGKTKQNLAISVKVSNGKVVKVTYTVKYGSCGTFSDSDKAPIAITNNTFSATEHPNSETVDKLSGSFNGKSVSGSLSSALSLGGIHPRTCRSGRVKFSGRL